MATTRTAHTVWNGDLMTGAGNTTLDSSGLGNFDVTWKARAEASEGKTSPEELIAAAHSACFSMAFSNALAQAGHTAEEINTKADVTFQPGTGITAATSPWPRASRAFPTTISSGMAEEAKAGCPVSAALTGIEITLDATLAS